jgi:hypothetical protein
MLIATRTLTWRDGERDVPVEIRIFAPQLGPEGSWACRFEIQWPDRPKEMTICGFDAIQALVLALQTIAVHVYTSEYHESGKLRWDKAGNGYGIPVGPNVRDLLEGDDKKYL